MTEKPYTIEDWHKEYDGRLSNFKNYDKQAELEAWKKWYSIPGNNFKKDLPEIQKLASIFKQFKEINQDLDKILNKPTGLKT